MSAAFIHLSESSILHGFSPLLGAGSLKDTDFFKQPKRFVFHKRVKKDSCKTNFLCLKPDFPSVLPVFCANYAVVSP